MVIKLRERSVFCLAAGSSQLSDSMALVRNYLMIHGVPGWEQVTERLGIWQPTNTGIYLPGFIKYG